MGAGNCCAGRDDEHVKARAREQLEKTWDFLQGEAIVSDVDRFDKAYAANDVKAFVDLLRSSEPIGKVQQKIHPWAADPTTIGSLATTQLAILAAKDDEPELKNQLREAGAIPILVANLSSKENDRLHASVVALSFLSVDNSQNCREIASAGAVPYLINAMGSDVEGLRGASAQICRNIYVLDMEQRHEFKRHGGIPALVQLLNVTEQKEQASSEGEEYFNQLEAVYHLEDLIMDAGEELPEFVADVKAAGATSRLEKLLKIPNNDLKEAAQYLLVRLTD